MAWDRIQANWKEHRPRLRKRWDKLTDDDLATMTGNRDELSARIQERYRIEREKADRQIDDWMNEPGALDDWNDRRPILDM
jgi:uncharacterized protein YjbJ (UPF0337 family)